MIFQPKENRLPAKSSALGEKHGNRRKKTTSKNRRTQSDIL